MRAARSATSLRGHLSMVPVSRIPSRAISTTSILPMPGSTHALRRIRPPVYMQGRPWARKAQVDADGIPLQSPDDTPHDFMNRPKRKTMIWNKTTTDSMKKYNSWDLLRTDSDTDPLPKYKWFGYVPRPRRKGIVPEPRNGMTVELFFKKIGRGCEQHASLFNSWEDLFRARRFEFKKLEIPLRDRKYIMQWLEKYRHGLEPRFIPNHSKAKRNADLEWRQALITQKAKREELGLD